MYQWCFGYYTNSNVEKLNILNIIADLFKLEYFKIYYSFIQVIDDYLDSK